MKFFYADDEVDELTTRTLGHFQLVVSSAQLLTAQLVISLPVKMAVCDECCGFNIKDVESYVKKHDIHYILKDCIIKLCSSRPDNPYRFMREYFENLEKVRPDTHPLHVNSDNDLYESW